MNEYLDPTDENFSSEEKDIEKALRPLTFEDFLGQEQVLENLQIFVKAGRYVRSLLIGYYAIIM